MWSIDDTQGSADPKYMHTTTGRHHSTIHCVLAPWTLLAAYTHRHSQADRQTDRQTETERQTDRQTVRQTDTDIHTWSDDDL